MKVCSKCHQEKKFEDFCKSANRKDGYYYYCRTCVAESNRTYKKEWRKNGGALKEKQSLEASTKRMMAKKISNLIRNTLTGNGYKKKTKTYSILGAEFEQVKLHIEKQFKEGMNWANHGEWHIDHIYPVAMAENKEMVYKLNHYTNLQPLWAKENLQKGARLNYSFNIST